VRSPVIEQPTGAQARHDLLGVPAAADYLRVSQRSVRELYWSQRIRTYRVGGRVLIDRADLDAYLAANSTPAAAS
jgi:excisionase family DNA binding protein